MGGVEAMRGRYGNDGLKGHLEGARDFGRFDLHKNQETHRVIAPGHTSRVGDTVCLGTGITCVLALAPCVNRETAPRRPPWQPWMNVLSKERA